MSETDNKTVVQLDPATVIESIRNNTGVYSSFATDNFDDQLKVLAAMSDAEPIVEHLGKVINLVDIVIHPVDLVNEETGELERQARTILIDDNGNFYAATSGVVVNRLRDMIGVLGEPATWERAVPIRIDRVKGNGKNFFYDMRVVPGTGK